MLTKPDLVFLTENFDDVCQLLGTSSEYYGETSAIFEDFSEIEVKIAIDFINIEEN